MTKKEAIKILHDYFSDFIQEDEDIHIGDVVYMYHRGYMISGGIYKKNKEKPKIFPLWCINSIDKSLCPLLF